MYYERPRASVEWGGVGGVGSEEESAGGAAANGDDTFAGGYTSTLRMCSYTTKEIETAGTTLT